MGPSDVEIKPKHSFKLKSKSKRNKLTISESSDKDLFSVSTVVVPSENLLETYSRYCR